MPYVEYQSPEKFSILDFEMCKSFECSVVDYLICHVLVTVHCHVSDLVLLRFSVCEFAMFLQEMKMSEL
jgi:hypothetical protein